MERNNQVSQTNTSKELSKKSLTLVSEYPVISSENKLSIYKGTLTLKVFIAQLNRLRKVFKDCDDDWSDVLRERLKANNFTDERLVDAVDNLFDKFKYGGKPNIAEIIDYDKTIKFFTYRDLLKQLNEDGNTFDYYIAVDIEGQPKYILKEQQKKYNIKLFKFEGKKTESKYPDISDEEKSMTASVVRKIIETMDNKFKKNSPKKAKTNPKYIDKNSPAYKNAEAQFQQALISEKINNIKLP